MEKYRHIHNYVPTTVENASEKEIAERNAVLDFMDGDISHELEKLILDRVRLLTYRAGGHVIITFIPSSSGERTMQRYGRLASYLARCTGIDVFPDALTLAKDADPILLDKRYVCRKDRVQGKTVILIGSIIITGRTFKDTSELLMKNGANDVEGLFIAKLKQ